MTRTDPEPTRHAVWPRPYGGHFDVIRVTTGHGRPRVDFDAVATAPTRERAEQIARSLDRRGE